LQQLAKKQLLQTKRADIFRRRSKQEYKKEYQITPKVTKAVLEGNRECLQKKVTTTLLDLLEEAGDLFEMHDDEEISSESMMEDLSELLQNNQNIPEIKWLQSHKDLTTQYIAILFMMLLELLDGEEDVQIDKIVRNVCDDMHDRITLRRKITDPKNPLLVQKLIQYSDEEFLSRNLLRVTEETSQKLLSGQHSTDTAAFRPVLCKLIQPETVLEETLYYNQAEEKQICLLQEALKEDAYKKIREGLLAEGLRAGFTLLLFGGPGTGKTASVKQLARLTGRNILMVEISKIQSKWVGESEKNLSRVFDEYRRCRKAYSLDPILLFNEADAILGKRTSVKSSVDKSYNAIQNILLQELEDFEGIFMATTNLADQLDAAFDRRFLYKVSFSQPELHVRKKILEQAFPGCQPGVLENLVNQYPLTGGQIMNVKKKLTIQLLLQPILNKEEVLHQLVKEELTLSAPPSKPVIGFLKPE
jgi:ATP-dependent Clp protease ATP-binding subunit ClpA